jgi:indole-3-glycerol phosphate synthase
MILDEIIRRVRADLNQRRRDWPAEALRSRSLFHAPRRGFRHALQAPGRRIIAEVKRASPSQGLIRDAFDPITLAESLAASGACALSVLTEEHFFQGSLGYLEDIRARVSLPLLRKDFVVDGYQLLEARSFGADAVLLIAAVLDRARLRELYEEAVLLGLDVLVEVHQEEELRWALDGGAAVVGINNRDLRTFEVSLETSARLAPLVPQDVVVVCESGIAGVEDIRRLEALGVRCFLVGEALMRSADPGAKLRELLS